MLSDKFYKRVSTLSGIVKGSDVANTHDKTQAAEAFAFNSTTKLNIATHCHLFCGYGMQKRRMEIPSRYYRAVHFKAGPISHELCSQASSLPAPPLFV